MGDAPPFGLTRPPATSTDSSADAPHPTIIPSTAHLPCTKTHTASTACAPLHRVVHSSSVRLQHTSPLMSALRPRFHALLSHTPMPCLISDPHATSQLAKPPHACRLPASSSPSAPAAPKTFGHAPRRAANAYFLAASTHAPPLMNSIYPCATPLYSCATAPPPHPCGMPHMMPHRPRRPFGPCRARSIKRYNQDV